MELHKCMFCIAVNNTSTHTSTPLDVGWAHKLERGVCHLLANIASYGTEGERAAEVRLQKQVRKPGQDCLSDAAAPLSDCLNLSDSPTLNSEEVLHDLALQKESVLARQARRALHLVQQHCDQIQLMSQKLLLARVG
jgi:hypothetical protein